MAKRKQITKILKRKRVMIPAIIMLTALVVGIIYISNLRPTSLQSNEKSIDLSFDQWDKTYPFSNSKVSDEGTFMRITSQDFYKEPSAKLEFDITKKIVLNFKIRTPELSMVKSSGLLVKSGDTILTGIINKGRFDALVMDDGVSKMFALLPVLDRNWHSIRIKLEILGDNSKITIVFDGNIIVENMNIKTTVYNVDTIFIYGSGGRNVPNITDFIFESLIITI